MTRKAWKAAYRLLRIARREGGKAAIDCMMWGTGAVLHKPNGECEHIPFADLRFPVAENVSVVRYEPPTRAV